jgi:4-phytase/acid phosphatase
MPQSHTCRRHAGRATVCVLTLVFAMGLAVAGAAETQPDSGQLLKVIVVSRHGVRTPLEQIDDGPHPLNGWTQRPGGWPKLEVWNPPTWPKRKAGDLTEVGSVLATIMGGYYRSRLGPPDDLFPAGRCPASNAVFIRADVDERTKATAEAIAKGLAEDGCPSPSQFPITITPNPKKIDSKSVDPLFHPAGLVCRLDAQKAVQRIVARLPPGKFAALDKENAATINEMQEVLKCCSRDEVCTAQGSPKGPPCRLTDLPTRVTSSDPRVPSSDPKADSIKMQGAIGMASTAAEIFLLEYANNLGINDVGWGQLNLPNGQLDPSKMARLLTLHNLQFEYMQRTWYIARRQGSMLLSAVLDTLRGGPFLGKMAGPMPPADAKFVVFVGHDTNIANLAAMLQTDWPASVELPDKTAPTGALLFELREKADQHIDAALHRRTAPALRRPAGWE